MSSRFKPRYISLYRQKNPQIIESKKTEASKKKNKFNVNSKNFKQINTT